MINPSQISIFALTATLIIFVYNLEEKKIEDILQKRITGAPIIDQATLLKRKLKLTSQRNFLSCLLCVVLCVILIMTYESIRIILTLFNYLQIDESEKDQYTFRSDAAVFLVAYFVFIMIFLRVLNNLMLIIGLMLIIEKYINLHSNKCSNIIGSLNDFKKKPGLSCITNFLIQRHFKWREKLD